MTTQKIASILSHSGFKAFFTSYEIVTLEDGRKARRQVRKGDFQTFKAGSIIGVETYGKNTMAMVEALTAKGINAAEARVGNGVIKIS